MNVLYIQGIFNETAGKRDQALAELTSYLENPVGIGEHSDLAVEMKKKLEEISRLEGVIETLTRHFGGPKGEESSDSPAPEVLSADPEPKT